MSFSIGFIGAGNMASALVGGLLAQDFKASRLALSDNHPEQLDGHKSRGLYTTTDNNELVARSDVLVLAVKPQAMAQVLKPLGELIRARQPLVISIAAGMTVASIEQWLGGTAPVVRAMPNTPALVQTGATGLYFNEQVSEAQKLQAQQILGAVGLTITVDQEALIDAVTALSGSGPAYYFLVMEAMQTAGVRLGLDPKAARALTLQTALGAAQMAITADVGPAELRRRVTSPGGTTEQAIKVFEEAGLAELFGKALTAAYDRAGQLANELGATKED